MELAPFRVRGSTRPGIFQMGRTQMELAPFGATVSKTISWRLGLVLLCGTAPRLACDFSLHPSPGTAEKVAFTGKVQMHVTPRLLARGAAGLVHLRRREPGSHPNGRRNRVAHAEGPFPTSRKGALHLVRHDGLEPPTYWV